MHTFLKRHMLRSFVLFVMLLLSSFVMLNPGQDARAASSAPLQPPDVVVCLLSTMYVKHIGSPPIPGDKNPMDLQYTYYLRNRGYEAATVNEVSIVVWGRHSNGNTIPTTFDIKQLSLPVPGNGEGQGLTGRFVYNVYVGPGTEENPFFYANSQVFWIGGHSTYHHTYDSNVGWANDPAC